MTMYQIRLYGHLDQRWEALFGGFHIEHSFTPEQVPVTVMTGEVADQAALYGLISQLRDLGVGLISVGPEGSCSSAPARF